MSKNPYGVKMQIFITGKDWPADREYKLVEVEGESIEFLKGVAVDTLLEVFAENNEPSGLYFLDFNFTDENGDWLDNDNDILIQYTKDGGCIDFVDESPFDDSDENDADTCVHFKNLDECHCNNDPDNPGECVYEHGKEPPTPSLPCKHYQPQKL